jgi:NADPH2:quinone reductase
MVAAVEPLALAEAGSVFFTRPHMADYMRDAAEIRGRAGEMFEHVQSGRLEVTVDRQYPLADAAQAHRDLEARKTTGKLLLDTRG